MEAKYYFLDIIATSRMFEAMFDMGFDANWLRKNTLHHVDAYPEGVTIKKKGRFATMYADGKDYAINDKKGKLVCFDELIFIVN